MTDQGFLIYEATVVDSDSEPTLVAAVNGGQRRGRYVYAAFFKVAELLGQDCIAVFSVQNMYGALIGPETQAWEAFDSSRFYLLDGKTLNNSL